MKWINKHPTLAFLLLITLGLTIWYGVTENALPIRISSAIWGLALMSWVFKKVGYMKEVDKAIVEEFEKRGWEVDEDFVRKEKKREEYLK